MHQHTPIWERARGRWPGILVAIGISATALRNKHGPCPICEGKDRFRFDDKGGDGTFFCSHCRAGTGVQLVMKFLGVDFKGAAQEIEKHLDTTPVLPASTGPRRDDGKLREIMTKLWQRGQPLSLNDPAGRYLNQRLGLTEFPTVMRQVAEERYVEDGKTISLHPAMVARVDPSDEARLTDQPAALHRTYLRADGLKADVGAPRKMLGSMLPGAAVRLMSHDDTLGIAEGIETALAASKLFNVPVWAALNANQLRAWTPPSNVKSVWIFGDNDANMTGQEAAFGLGRRLIASGHNAIVELPQLEGTDWNDVLKERGL
jgi:putative DNA primase/helicase